MNKQKKIKLTSQENFIQKHNQHRVFILFSRFFIFILFLLIWEVCANFKIIDAFFFSSPSRIIQCFWDLLYHNELLIHISYTISETMISFLCVMILGISIASVLWFYETLSQIIEPYLVMLNSLPKSALAPLFIVWLGTGMKTIIIAGASVALFGCIISIYTGFQQIDKDKVLLIYTLGGNKIDVFKKIILPGSIPTILSTLKVNIGLSLVGVIIGEFLAARKGLGYLIIYGSQIFQLNMVITSIFILCIIAMILYKLVQCIELKYLKKI